MRIPLADPRRAEQERSTIPDAPTNFAVLTLYHTHIKPYDDSMIVSDSDALAVNIGDETTHASQTPHVDAQRSVRD